ncbi:YciI family protein [Corallococcus exiguus]|uniref:YciI family protein n=1 Tax=Corallococcus TaxID=83461 RepID=UPI000EA054B2|nr:MULTISPECIES: YciI family protein [Corallococcus]RKI49096.1 YciI family protein [Corallococcus sp. AB004]NNB84490.1 YciI family protein [Corallococcus exiguus]NNB93159.1 YciI family protein [Corallococcus exiguus]NNC01860.1 YciI family protein [Corallococcus exiguus]NPC45895.1 YciI family protein [Corallococcus exiguus]
MRFMMIVKANTDSETGRIPSTEELTSMGKYNEELVKAGILLAGEGLHPSSKGARVAFSKTGNTVTDGPFSETKELVAGFWIIEVKSREEAIAWARRIPFQEGEVEIRQVASAEDFAESDPTGELRAKEEALRAQVEAKAKA